MNLTSETKNMALAALIKTNNMALKSKTHIKSIIRIIKIKKEKEEKTLKKKQISPLIPAAQISACKV